MEKKQALKSGDIDMYKYGFHTFLRTNKKKLFLKLEDACFLALNKWVSACMDPNFEYLPNRVEFMRVQEIAVLIDLGGI